MPPRKKRLNIRNLAKMVELNDESTDGKKLPYVCNICGKGFLKIAALMSHVRTHTVERPFVCKTCGKDFAQKHVLRNHMTTHSGIKPFKCYVCSRTFLTSTTLKQHLRIHTGEKPIKCSLCEERFRHRYSYHCHMKRHSNQLPVKCPYCIFSFETIRCRNMHIKRYHKLDENGRMRKTSPRAKKEKKNQNQQEIVVDPVDDVGCMRVECQNCLLCFYNKKEYQDHAKECLKSDNRHRKGTWKKMTFTTKDDYAKEEKMSGSSNDAVISSEMGAAKKSRGKRDRSLSRRRGSDMDAATRKKHVRARKRLLMCDICNLAFSYKESLEHHLLIHTVEDPFACGICEKRFKILARVKTHVLTHSRVRPYECTHCEECFRTGVLLKNHVLQNHHSEPGNKCQCHEKAVGQRFFAGNRQQFYKCHYCEIGFIQKNAFEDHLLKHEEDQRKVRVKQELEEQQSILTLVKKTNFTCEWCQATFVHLKELNSHIQTHVSKKSKQAESLSDEKDHVNVSLFEKSDNVDSEIQSEVDGLQNKVFTDVGLDIKDEDTSQDQKTRCNVGEKITVKEEECKDDVMAITGKKSCEEEALEGGKYKNVKEENMDEESETVQNVKKDGENLPSDNGGNGEGDTSHKDELDVTSSSATLAKQTDADVQGLPTTSSSSSLPKETVCVNQTSDRTSEEPREIEHVIGGKSFEDAIAKLRALETLV